ncbi:MAG: recombination protein RecR [Deltaproteobacteria bacterium]|nr:recombination protein RecR [Deltaproteobacteria bacterium]
MNYYPLSIRNLIKNITRLPGIGQKTAERLAIHILNAPIREAELLAGSILDVKKKVKKCSLCFSLSDDDICNICGNSARDAGLLCIVEGVTDMVAIEKSGSFNGLYHILGGVLSPMDGIGPENIRIGKLVNRISQGKIKEVVIATSTRVEGDSTAAYIAQLLQKYSVKVTRIASGVPIGGELKYVDQVTMKRAMDTRHTI